MSASSPAQRLLSVIREGSGSTHAVLFVGAENSEIEAVTLELINTWMGCELDRPLDRNIDVLRVAAQGSGGFITVQMIVPKNPTTFEGTTVQMFLRTRPLIHQTKVVWIDRPERMNDAASNALLKMLEEPPAHARFVLTSSSLSGIAQTIISRCCVVACQPGEDDGDWSPAERLFCEGSLARRAKMREKPGPYEDLHSFLNDLLSRKPSYAIRATEQFLVLADKLPGSGTREKNVEGLRMVAAWVRHHQLAPSIGLKVAEAHRRVTMMGHSGMQLDPLFCEILLAKN
ncbi:MAG: hypothetical protein JNJ45_00045 [Chthonomonas sp.]|nr:hypothetical protein [Chthonomonas sp.]